MNKKGLTISGILAVFVLLLLAGGCSKKDNDIKEQTVFTLDELKKYDGKNGNPAYVAVNDVVYDVTDSALWEKGVHSQCSDSTYAGTDLSDLINSSPHGAYIMERMPVVGKIIEQK